jgi:hypothetical protein
MHSDSFKLTLVFKYDILNCCFSLQCLWASSAAFSPSSIRSVSSRLYGFQLSHFFRLLGVLKKETFLILHVGSTFPRRSPAPEENVGQFSTVFREHRYNLKEGQPCCLVFGMKIRSWKSSNLIFFR